VRPSAALLWVLVGIVAFAIGGVTLASVVDADEPVWPILAILALVLVLCVISCFWRITISNRGVTIRSAVGLIRQTIPLDTISGVRVVQISPIADFGGWGIRFGAGRTGYVVRGGEALEIARTAGRSVVVTVDDAATATALLEGLLSRRTGA
jgi:hypothetical protein